MISQGISQGSNFPHNTPAIRFGKNGVLLRNLHCVHKDFWRHALQDPIVLKDNALILSSLLLVLTRMFAVNKSAIQARGTSEEHHRKNEAVKTMMREAGGFTFSFLVLRYFQSLAKGFVRRTFGLPSEGGLFISTKSHFKSAIQATKRGEFVEPDHTFLTPGYTKPDDPTKMIDAYKRYNMDRYFKNKALIHNTIEEQVKNINKNVRLITIRFPVVVGSIPAILLGGYFLERFTQGHANQVSEKITTWWNNLLHKNVSQPLETTHAPLPPGGSLPSSNFTLPVDMYNKQNNTPSPFNR